VRAEDFAVNFAIALKVTVEKFRRDYLGFWFSQLDVFLFGAASSER